MCLEFIAIFQYLANRAIKAALDSAKQKELALRESERRYRDVYETTSDCLFLMDVMPDGRFLGVGLNPACERLLGVTSAEIVGKTAEEVIAPQAARTLNADLKRCVDQGAPIEYERASPVVHGPRAGQMYYLHSTLIPMKDAAGRVFRILGVAHNISERKKAEAALRESEQRYREVYEATSDCIFLIDVTEDGRFLGAGHNPTCEKLFGITSAEVIGMTPEEVVGPEATPRTIAHFKRCISGGVPISYERFITSPSGQSLYLHTTLIPMKNAEGAIFRIIGVSHNITEQKKVEAALRESEQRYREVFENTADNIFLVEVTTEGRFLFSRFNPAAEKMAGLASAEVAGKSPEQIFPPELARAVTGHYQRCVAKGSSIDYEEEIAFPSKQCFYFHTTLIPMKNAEGRTFRIVGVSRNITDRKQAEAALRESEQRHREVFETTSDVIFMLDVTADGRFLSYRFNPAAEKMVGFKSAEVAGKELDQFFPPELARTLNANYRRCIETGSSIEYEELITSLDGQSYSFYTTLIPVKDAEGRVFRIVGVARNITDRKRAEAASRQSRDELELRIQERTAELAKVNKELEAFSFSVSHDLRRPLRAVTGFTEMLMADYAGNLPADAQNLLGLVRESATQMNQLIDALMNLSRIEREPLVPRPVNLTELARLTARELQAESPDRKLDIRVAEMPGCMGDPALLRQVFANLLSNAVKFTRDRPVAIIEVGCKMEEGKMVCFVRDNGAGFDMSQAGKLFGVFQRLHSAKEFGGTGIGLSIVRRIIHRHGGRIWAEGEVDKGATFYFTIPEEARTPSQG